MSALSSPVARRLLHSRRVACFGYARDDGLWDIEGHLVDTKTYDLHDLDRGPTPAGQPLHEMWLRLTVDIDLNIVAVEAKTVWGPYAICGEITPNFQRLKGLAIRPGFSQKSRELLGGVEGCTHLVELLGPIATTAFQTVYSEKVKRDRTVGGKKRPALIDSCHAWASDGPVVERRFPEFFTGKKKAG
ncbi:MAG TPA: DUF2889 domain-containing protein [Burkholderiales bacterium]|jgi:hypothetical protein|nr:DUF2889 domain-containing protein [Burkholderiales bacterium]